MSKQFGLIIPGKERKQAAKPTCPPTRPSVFDESSNSDNSDENSAAQKLRPLKEKLGVVGGPSVMERRKARHLQEKALAEDPTIFQYDELYDEMDNKREEAKETSRNEPRKAKYIGRLMAFMEQRKLENELRIERQVQKDREAEGEKFKDKETYVTAAYRKKLESIRQLQEKEERDEYLEAIGDVTKQKDLDGFYRHLYEQKLGTQQPVLKPKTAPSTDEVAYKPIKSDVASSSKQRSYRRRRSSEDDEKPSAVEPTAEAKDESKTDGGSSSKAHLHNNIDADSDFSIDDSSDEEKEQQSVQKPRPAATANYAKKAFKLRSLSKPHTDDTAKDKKLQTETETVAEPEVKVEAKVEADSDSAKQMEMETETETEEAKEDEPTVVKPPIDRTQTWRKRTVGAVFDAAVARYHERKLARCA